MDDYGNPIPSRLRRVAGSLDNGATDAEYTPHPERLICASEEHYATRADVDDLGAVLDELVERVEALEGKQFVNAVPWAALRSLIEYVEDNAGYRRDDVVVAQYWLRANAPKEAAE